MEIRTKTAILAVSLFAMTLAGVPVLAVGSNSPANVQAQTTDQSSEPSSQGSTRLEAAKLKACQNREKAINNIMARMAERGSKQLGVLNKIAERTMAFYVDKGKTLSNYEALVAAVNDKKAAAQAAVDDLKASSVGFKCDGSDPKGAAQSFKDKLKAEIAALKDYKTAVKNLIVGVKSVQGTTSSSDNSQGGQQ